MALTVSSECGRKTLAGVGAPVGRQHEIRGVCRRADGERVGSQGESTDYDVIIVGGGPAGAAAAMQLAARGVAARTLLLDRAVFPRHKLCGGGVVRDADRLLGILGVRSAVPSVPIHRVRFQYAGGQGERCGPDLFRVVRREEFDDALLREVQARGVAVRQGAAATRVERAPHGITIAAAGEAYRCAVLIGADGANSLVRRALIGGYQPRFVALEVLTPIPAAAGGTAEAHTAVFDFRPAALGLRGYRWDFPSVRAGEPWMNRGLGGAAWRGEGSMKALFAAELARGGVAFDAAALQGATAPLYHPTVAQSAPHVLLAGDAVGIDPWFGEGISVALGTGILAANAAADALARQDFRFPDHRRRIRESAVGWMLRRNRATARGFYRAAPLPRGLAAWFGPSGAAA